MKREDLIKVLFGEDASDLTDAQKSQVDQIMALHGQSTEALKTKAETAETEAAGFKKQLEDANSVIEGFKRLDVDGIKAAADEWKAKAEKAEADGKAQVAQLKFDQALAAALTGAKAKNPVTVRALLNVDDLKLSKDGALVGLNEQLAKIKSENDYLFESDKPEVRIIAGASGTTINDDSFLAAMRRGAGLPGEGA